MKRFLIEEDEKVVSMGNSFDINDNETLKSALCFMICTLEVPIDEVKKRAEKFEQDIKDNNIEFLLY